MAVSARRLVLLTLGMAASVAWAFVVFVYSTDSSPPDVSEIAGRLDFLPRPDLFVHFEMYGLLSLCLMLSLLPIWIERRLVRTGLPVLGAGLCGISLELVQNTTPERSGGFDDGAVDVLSAIAHELGVRVTDLAGNEPLWDALSTGTGSLVLSCPRTHDAILRVVAEASA